MASKRDTIILAKYDLGEANNSLGRAFDTLDGRWDGYPADHHIEQARSMIETALSRLRRSFPSPNEEED